MNNYFPAHVACLRVATPIDQLPLIDAQLSQSHHLLRSYASSHHSLSPHEKILILFWCKSEMVSVSFATGTVLISLCSFKDSFSNINSESMLLKLLWPAVKLSRIYKFLQEQHLEREQGFRSKLKDVRRRYCRRRAGKLPGDTTAEDDKAKLVEETGLQLKQINNWFINQRKRNWHSNSEQLCSGAMIEGTFPILNGSGKPCKEELCPPINSIHSDGEGTPLSPGGVGGDHSIRGVPGTYFPLRRGGKITLYQDAHVPDGSLPNLWLENGVQYQHGQKELWEHNDEETRRYFKHSSVQVLLCPRSAGKGHSWAKKQETETIYTHHQKTVIVDADAGNYQRKIMAFVGGLDLCKGRYDTPQHPIFRTLENVHRMTIISPNYCVDRGLQHMDVLTNFEERWLKASKRHGLQKMKASHDDALLKLDRIRYLEYLMSLA
ncbi:hypothetical protein HAX54_015021 [Datura stramonium]|uniref:phospholipase D n=1 Tax=Datura stramonium TaxID=4076 RepID=A0ABS8RZ86_DATST|nr:hypothetical protein [Datura stramonium]